MISTVIFETAKSQIGVWEWAEGSNPAVQAYFREAGHPNVTDDATPWCAAFVGSMLARVGLPSTGSLLARSYLEYGEDVGLDPFLWRTGDIMVFRRGNSTWQGHVAFYAGNQGAGKVSVLGGNQRDQVSISEYARADLLGVRRAVAPRESPAQSKTLRGIIAAAVSGGTGTVAAFGQLDPVTQAIVATGAVVTAIALIVIFRDRLRSWHAKGNR